MKSISLAIVIAIFTSSFVGICNAQTNKTGSKENNSAHRSDSTTFNFLKKYEKKYPNEVRLLDNSTLKKRLKVLLGNRYPVLKAKWAVESPIEVKNDLFIAYACQAHNCDVTNFMIIVDMKHNIVYAGIREEQKVNIYTEDGSKGPKELQEWAVQK